MTRVQEYLIQVRSSSNLLYARIWITSPGDTLLVERKAQQIINKDIDAWEIMEQIASVAGVSAVEVGSVLKTIPQTPAIIQYNEWP